MKSTRTRRKRVNRGLDGRATDIDSGLSDPLDEARRKTDALTEALLELKRSTRGHDHKWSVVVRRAKEVRALLDSASLAENTASPVPTSQMPAFTQSEETALARGGIDSETLLTFVRPEHRSDEAKYRALLTRSLTVEQAAHRLGVNSSRIRQRLAEGSLYGIKLGHIWHIPAFQFSKAGLVPGIEKIFGRLPHNLSPLAVQRWLTTPNPDLCTRDEEEPMTPLEWLRTGHSPEEAAALVADL